MTPATRSPADAKLREAEPSNSAPACILSTDVDVVWVSAATLCAICIDAVVIS
ncbi:hypothetical protein D3C87_2056200 [compost metagenome]